VVGRYKGTSAGLLWSVLVPLAMLAIYTFVFSVIMEVRWNRELPESRGMFALTMFSGLVAFNLFAEVVNRAPGLVRAHPSYVRHVIFPVELLPAVSVLVALVNLVVGYLVWLMGWVWLGEFELTATVLILPIVLLPGIFLSLGAAWLLAAAGVFVRDLETVMPLATQALFFLTPIVYSLDHLPDVVRPIFLLNPLTPLVENVRAVLVGVGALDWAAWGISLAIGLGLTMVGFRVFVRAKRVFADVL